MKTLLALFFLITGLSCSKSNDDEDKSLPVITISSPSNGAIFTSGQPISIQGTVSDDKFIAETHIHVSNTNTGALLMDVHVYPNGNSANFAESITAQTGVNYKIQVIAKDRSVNEARASVEVTCN